MIRTMIILTALMFTVSGCGNTKESQSKRVKMGDRARGEEAARNAKRAAEREKARREAACKRDPKKCEKTDPSVSPEKLFAELYEKVDLSCDIYVLDKEKWDQKDEPQKPIEMTAFPEKRQRKEVSLKSPSNSFKADILVISPQLVVMNSQEFVDATKAAGQEVEPVEGVAASIPGVKIGGRLTLTELSSEEADSDDFDTDIPVGLDQEIIAGQKSMTDASGKVVSVTLTCKLIPTFKEKQKQ